MFVWKTCFYIWVYNKYYQNISNDSVVEWIRSLQLIIRPVIFYKTGRATSEGASKLIFS